MLSAVTLASGAAAATSSPSLKDIPTPQRLHVQDSKSQRMAAPRAQAPSGEWTEWEFCGTGTLTMDDMFAIFTGLDEWQGDFAGIQVDQRHDVADPTLVQYRLNGAFNNAEIVVDYDTNTNLLTLQPQNSHIDMYGDELMVADVATAYTTISCPDDLGMTQEEFDDVVEYYAAYNYAIPTLGRMYIYTGFYPEGWTDLVALSDITFQFDGYADFKPTIQAPRYVGDEAATATVDFDNTAAGARIACCKGLPGTVNLQAVLAGSVPHTDIAAGGEVVIEPAEGPGLYTFLGITFDLSGQALEWGYTMLTYTPDDNDKWEPLGNAVVNNTIMEEIFGQAAMGYEVPAQRSLDGDRSLIRLVNPHGAAFYNAFPHTEDWTFDAEFNHYLVFDVTDPGCVLPGTAHLGLDFNGEDFFALSTAEYLIAQGQDPEFIYIDFAGKLEDGVITMPSRSISMGCTDWTKFGEEPDILVATNISGKFSVTLPTTSVGADIATPSNDVRFYNLQGIELDSPLPGHLVIMVTDGQATKLIAPSR